MLQGQKVDRAIIIGIAVVVFGWDLVKEVIRPIWALNVEEWAKGHSLDAKLKDNEGVILEWLALVYSAITSDPIRHALVGAALYASLPPLISLVYRKATRKVSKQPEPASDASDLGRFNLEAQQRAISRVREYVNPNLSVEIVLASPAHVPLGEALASVFRLSGWKVDFNKTPQEPFNHQYWSGIAVRACNRHLLEVVRVTLQGAGLPASPELTPNTVQESNPKWPYAEHRITIRIGHH
jgi:hypothetical protein